jgi:uncharacterized membrane protein YqiK
METAIVSVEVQAKIKETTESLSVYDNYIIDSIEKYRASADDVKAIKAKYKELDDTRKSLTAPIEESKKKIIALFKSPLDFLKRAEEAVKKAMVSWQTEQEKIRRAEEARLAEIQRKEAEKLQAQAAREAARAESLKTDKAKAAAKAQAEKLEAEAVAVTSITPVVESSIEEVAGISTRKIWKFKVINADDIPREYMIPDEKFIGQIVRASKGKKQIAGIEIYSEDIIASR